MTLFLTWFLSLIPIGVPPSTWRPTSPSHPTTFFKASPSILKVRWYVTCILESHFWDRKPVNTTDSLYPPFEVYLTTIYSRLSFFSYLRIEGDALKKVVGWLGDVGRQVEGGTPIGISDRNQVRNKVIQLYNCGFQYERKLKTER